MCCAVYHDSAKYIFLSGNSNGDRVGRQRRELDFFLITLCTSNKCPNYTQPIPTICDPQTSVFPQRCTTVSQVDRLILVLWGQGAVCSGMKGDVMKVSPKQHLCLR